MQKFKEKCIPRTRGDEPALILTGRNVMTKFEISHMTSYGQPAYPASEKQEKWAANIAARINDFLSEIRVAGFDDYADQIILKYTKNTNQIAAGARDVIDFLREKDRAAMLQDFIKISRVGRKAGIPATEIQQKAKKFYNKMYQIESDIFYGRKKND